MSAELQSVLTNDNRQFIRSMKEAESAAKKTGANTEKAFSGSNAILGKVGESVKGALAVGAVVMFTKSILDMGGELQDTSDRLNLNVESLQGLQFAFGQSGASSENFGKGMVKLNQSLDDAREGNDKLTADFEKLGINFKQVQEDSPESILYAMADGMKEAKDPTAALAAAMDILGKNGQALIPGLKGGSQALKELAAEAAKLSAEEIADLDAAGDALTQFGNKLKIQGAHAVIGWKQIYNAATTGDFRGKSMVPDFEKGFKPILEPTVPKRDAEEDQTPAQTGRSARGRKLSKEESDLLDEMGKEEAAQADQADKDLMNRQKLWLDIKGINEDIFDTTQETARAGMSSEELILSLTKERAYYLGQAARYEKDIFGLHERDAAQARLRAAKIQQQIKEAKANQPQSFSSSVFEQQAKEMESKMKAAAGFSTFENAGVMGSAPVNGLHATGLNVNGIQGSGGLTTGGGLGDAYGKIRRGDAARSKAAAEAAKKEKDPQEGVLSNTAALVEIFGGQGVRK